MYCKNLVLKFFGFETCKKSKRDIRKKHSFKFSAHFDGLDQLLLGIGNYLFIKWCPGIINSKLNVVRLQIIANFIPIIKIPGNHINYSMKWLSADVANMRLMMPM